jgi:hypothetical protein
MRCGVLRLTFTCKQDRGLARRTGLFFFPEGGDFAGSSSSPLFLTAMNPFRAILKLAERRGVGTCRSLPCSKPLSSAYPRKVFLVRSTKDPTLALQPLFQGFVKNSSIIDHAILIGYGIANSFFSPRLATRHFNVPAPSIDRAGRMW